MTADELAARRKVMKDPYYGGKRLWRDRLKVANAWLSGERIDEVARRFRTTERVVIAVLRAVLPPEIRQAAISLRRTRANHLPEGSNAGNHHAEGRRSA